MFFPRTVCLPLDHCLDWGVPAYEGVPTNVLVEEVTSSRKFLLNIDGRPMILDRIFIYAKMPFWDPLHC